MTHYLRLIRLSIPLFGLVISLQAQPVNTLIKDVSMAAPNAAALGKYGDIPVSYFTGVPSISIPIHTVQEGPLQLPISLSYHSSGVKVGEMASWVGLGWSLNAGGMISRTVLGLADDKSDGYYHTGSTLNGGWTHVDQAAAGTRDSEPDLFSFTIGGRSGKFYFDRDKKCNFIPREDFKMEVTLGGGTTFNAFKIIDTDGTYYLFSEVEQTQETATGSASLHNSSWYLKEVGSADGKHKIFLTYTAETYTYGVARTGRVIKHKAQKSGCIDQNQQVVYSVPASPTPYAAKYTSQVYGKRLATISTSTETITFAALTQREDMVSANNRLDYIEVSTGSGAYCKRYHLSYTYFQDNTCATADCKRLQLTQVQEKSCDNSTVVPPHVFTYEGALINGKLFLPQRFSKAIDHWGFYNGATGNDALSVNVPSTNVPFEWTTFTYGSANRETNESEMKRGVLKQITYPTGGHSAFQYEANTYSVYAVTGTTTTNLIQNLSNCSGGNTPPSCCNMNSPTQQATLSGPLGEYFFDLSLDATTGSGCSGGFFPYVEVEVRKASDNSYVGSYSINTPDGTYGAVTNKPLSLISNSLQSGVAYKYTLIVWDGRANFSLYRKVDTYGWVNKPVGGLRVKEIRSHDGYDTTKDVVRTYVYTDSTNAAKSSGQLLQMPTYGFSRSYDSLGVHVDLAIIEEVGVVPLSDFGGYHIGYARVEELHNGNGKTVYTHYTETQTHGNAYPYPPALATVQNGKTKSVSQWRQSGINPEIARRQEVPLTVVYNQAPGWVYKAQQLPIPEVICGQAVKFYNRPFYLPRTGAYRLQQVVSNVDGVSTTTTFSYDSQNRHLAPTVIAMTNSDGQVTQTVNSYLFDYPLTALRDTLISRNMIGAPWKTTTVVGSDTLSGNKQEYAFFTAAGALNGSGQSSCTGCFPRLYKTWQLERTWGAAGSLLAGSWTLQGTLGSYTSAGLPAQFTQTGWAAETYVWDASSKQIKERAFQGFVTKYEYYPGTRLLKSITEVDGQKTDYSYDKLMRLSGSSARGGNVSSAYQYQYKDGSNPYNFIKTTLNQTTVSGSALGQRQAVQYLDGLGRPLQEVKQQYRPTKGANDATFTAVDVVMAYTYDNQGRVVQQTVPYLSPNTSGAYYAAPGGTPYALTSYEASPLNRPLSTTPPGGFATSTSYGTNSTAITLPGVGGLSYAANTLRVTTVTDPDGRKQWTYTDRKGRTILQEQEVAPGSTAKTYYQYDGKDRLLRVLPPEATADSVELVYRYRYSGDDLLVWKKVPGMDSIRMAYNDRDLLTLSQDGRQRQQGVSVGTTYDTFGRPTQTGLVSGYPANPSAPLSYTTSLTKTYYDGFDGTTSLNLTTYPQYRGRIRRTEVRALDGASQPWLHSTYTYDTYGRTTQVTGNNYLNTASTTAESIVNTYDYADNLLTTTRTHQPGSGAATGNQTIKFTKQYDSQGRPINYLLDLNTVGTHLAEYNYDHRDRLIERNLHSGLSGSTWYWLQSVDYAYNERDWLTAINTSTVTGSAMALPGNCATTLPSPGTTTLAKFQEGNDLFYEELRYDQLLSTASGTSPGAITGITGGVAEKGGNISQVIWRTRGRERQAYNLVYDKLGRLTTATYYDVNNSHAATGSNRYNESQSYDVRGNIKSLQRQGFVAGSCNFGQIDNLTYSYPQGSNRLSSITDSSGKAEGARSSTYLYDSNGNVIKDTGKCV
ncbi:MAG: RHS repeat protein [Lewinellaceae bacterium]|nr:RHS repeat protein [Lewinellaceae bacterium]